MERILVVDDEPGIRMVLRGVLQSSGYSVDAVESGETALERLAHTDYDLLLVDLQMDGMDGLNLIEQVHARQPDLATVILTGFATVDSAVWALRGGVDDYVVKPAGPEEIRVAVRRALDRRRTNQGKAAAVARIAQDLTLLSATLCAPATLSPSTTVVGCGPLLLDEAAHKVEWQGRPLTLTPTEFRLLACLARNAGKVLSPQTLVVTAQGFDCAPLEARELIKPHIYSLRAKLEPDPANPRFLVNVRGVGYALRLEE